MPEAVQGYRADGERASSIRLVSAFARFDVTGWWLGNPTYNLVIKLKRGHAKVGG